MTESFLKIISKFANPEERITASKELAHYVGAEGICCFIYDPLVNHFLPALGFPQTLRHAKIWQLFLAVARQYPVYNNKIKFEGEPEKNVLCISSSNGCILTLINVEPGNSYLDQLRDAFGLIAAVLKTESLNQEMFGKLKNAEQDSSKAAQLAKYLDTARTKLHLALKTEEEFLSIASHELKTPVTSLNSFLQILLQQFPDEDGNRTHYILSRAKLQVDRLIRLIADLLDVTKIKTGKLELHVEPVSLNDLIDDQLQDYSATVKTHQVTREGSVTSLVTVDKSRIEQVIVNLLSNAVKYSRKGEKIIISLSETPQHIQVDVRDFGIGISAGNINRVFDRFFRANGEDSGMLSSLGLGLYICSDIIKRHKGNIWVDSELGHGSVFHFTLPKSEPPST